MKLVVWIGSSKRDFRDFPADVKFEMGHAPFLAQNDGRHRKAKIFKGAADAEIVELVADHRGDTFRTIYTVGFVSVIFVLHAFQ